MRNYWNDSKLSGFPLDISTAKRNIKGITSDPFQDRMGSRPRKCHRSLAAGPFILPGFRHVPPTAPLGPSTIEGSVNLTFFSIDEFKASVCRGALFLPDAMGLTAAGFARRSCLRRNRHPSL